MRRPIFLLAPACVAALLALSACGETRELAATVSSSQCAGCHGDASTPSSLSGAHAAHVGDGGLAPPLACAECHTVPAAIDAPGHQDGKVDVVFGERGGGAAATWDRAGGTCAVYCHGSSMMGGSVPAPHWTGDGAAQMACHSCHGAPPPAPHPTTSASCGSCHAAPLDSTGMYSGTHMDGKVDMAGGGAPACGSCHSIPPPAPHTTSTQCGSCHTGYSSTAVNAALHQNGIVDVISAPACGSCHGIPPPAPHTTSTQCGSCHTGYSSTAVNAALHQNGTVDVSATQACGSCHAIPPSSGQHRKHVSDERIACGTCHSGASSTNGGPNHLNGVVNVTAPGWNASTTSCANSCHGTERW
jgi:predicted CxxxxCH...CXXCH cytochrome family protein